MKSHFRFYLRLFVAVFAVAFTAALLWFIFRVEQYIISRLPQEITVGKLSVSFLNQAFVFSDARIYGRPGTACDGKLILEVAEAEGKFRLKEKKLTDLSLKSPVLKPEAFRKGCFIKPGEKPDLRLGEGIGSEGLRVQISNGRVPVSDWGDAVVSAALSLRENEHGALIVAFERFSAAHARATAETKKAVLALVKNAEGIRLSDGEIMGTLRVNHLEKLPRLQTKKLRVLAGDAELRFSAGVRKGEWTIYTNVDLRRIKLKGDSFFSMPMGLMQLTPENMWPMAEDSPGHFGFSFKTQAEREKLAKTYAADFRIALTRKLKGNLKKKIPVLPF